jgi:uncharacterized protein YchJ
MISITNYDDYRKSIQRLKIKYPHLYQIKADFFKKIENSADRRKLSQYYRKKMAGFEHILSKFFYDDDFEDDDEEEMWDDSGDDDCVDYNDLEPYVRQEAKIGRNDPCPCGSGKKYKKCCGK